MNDRYNIYFETNNGNDIGEAGELENNSTELPEHNESDVGNGVAVSDAMGSDNSADANTENNEKNIEGDTVDNTESGLEAEEEFFADYQENEAIDYTPELEYIDYLLSMQIQNQISVQSENGKSIVVSLDDSSMQALTEIKQNQIITHEKCELMINLVGCLLLAVVLEYLIMSSKRVVKKMTNRKD